MAPKKPDPQEILRAIDIYIKHAYGDAVPVLVKSQLSNLRAWKGDFYEASLFAPDQRNPPTRYSARLGNGFYPHMKLVFELSPDDKQFLFRVDTHDRHVCPSERAPEFNAFQELMHKNQRLVEDIETDWAAEGLPTFRTYLKEDLTRRFARKGEAL